MSRHFVNAPDEVVLDSLEGLVLSTPHLRRLDGFPDVKVVIRDEASSSNADTVQVISGDIFASPTTEAVLAAIRAVTGPAGALLLIMNYTGDRLNFGLAAEQAKVEGFKVEMVVVGDDCALPAGTAQRGIAGTVFMLKVAGALAARGLPLEAVKGRVEVAAQGMASMGVASSVGCAPGGRPSDRLAAGTMELGLGIHGEPGARQAKLLPAKQVVDEVLDNVLSSLPHGAATGAMPVALLVNSLGGLMPMELSLIAQAAIRRLAGEPQGGAATARPEVDLQRVYVGAFMTSLDMSGFSLTLLLVSHDTLALLDAPTQEGVAGGGPGAGAAFAAAAERALRAAAEALVAASTELDAIDSKVGDGDCGATHARGARAILADLPTYPLVQPAGTVAALAASLRCMGGTSGALYNILLLAAAGSLTALGRGEPESWAGAWAGALGAGLAAVQRYGRACEGDRTMLDALLPAQRALAAAAAAGRSGTEAAEAAAAAARDGAELTKQLAAAAGRSSYVPSAAQQGVPDPGALAAALWLRATAEALRSA